MNQLLQPEQNLDKTVFVTGQPSWLPGPLCDTTKEIRISFKFSRAERKVFRKRRRIPVSEWSEKYRVLTMSSLPGKWNNQVTQYLVGIMDASFFPSVQTVIICKAPQTGGSEAINNCIGYAIDRDPGPVLYVYPDEQTAKDNSRDRIRPMITSSARLRENLTGLVDDTAAYRINLQHMPIYMGWASSASRLANKPIRIVVFDETDKYPDTANKRETDPISLGEKRTNTYRWNRKIFKISSPSIEKGLIWQALTTEAQIIFEFVVVCPFCASHQVMFFDQIKWPKNEEGKSLDPEKIVSENLAWYECEACQKQWDDYARDKAVRAGYWRSKEDKRELFVALKTHRPQKIGFHLPSWLSYFVSLSEVAASFLKGQKSKTALKDFMNGHKAEPWLEYEQERKEDRILALADERPRGLVPSGSIVSCLTAAVDSQDRGYYYEIRAWGFGMELESWMIREGFVDTNEALLKILFQDLYQDVDGKKYHVHLAIIDAMGHRTAEVYDLCRLNRRRLIPYKGERTMTQPHAWSKIDVYPGTNKPIPGGVRLLRAHTNYYKDNLSSKLEISPADPGAWHLHSEATEEYARQMCAEYVDEKGFWACPDGKPNHYWDCSVLNLLAADLLQVKFINKELQQSQKTKGRRVRSKGVSS